MSLLQIISDVADMVAVPRPAVVLASTDQDIRTILGLANTEGVDLARRFTWEALEQECVATTTATETQGAIATLAPGFRYMLNDTIWNRTYRRPMPLLDAQDWQMRKASSVNGPYQQYRLRAGKLLFIPAPATGQIYSFEYASTNWVVQASGSTTNRWAADTDTSLLSEEIMTQGIRWRYLRQKGMDYSEEFVTYERMVADAMARDGSRDVIRFGATTTVPKLQIPEGDYLIP